MRQKSISQYFPTLGKLHFGTDNSNFKTSVNRPASPTHEPYSVHLKPLAPDDVRAFILGQLDQCGLPHNTFTDDALALVIRSSEGFLRRIRNLCVSALLEIVRDRQRETGLEQINRVLMQPHWRKEHDLVAQ